LTTFAALVAKWDCTSTEEEFLGAVLEQIRKGETFGAGRRRPITREDMVEAVRAVAYDAECQAKWYRSHFYEERALALDAAHNALLAMLIKWNKIEPIIREYGQQKRANA
jgi:hypothetical protein